MAKRAKEPKPAPSPAKSAAGSPLGDIRHPAAKRKNNPPAGIAAEGDVRVIPKAQYAYNPHLPPVLRFHPGTASPPGTPSLREGPSPHPDALPELIAAAGQRPLTPEEQQTLAAALRNHEPWLEWTGKRERPSFAVDPVALHIHERISAQAILKVAARQDVNKSLFADPQQEYHEAVQFYKHDVDWSNRLILGDSLQVMSSLARREDLAGKVQMIYMDPPYGIKFASNFQPEVGKRDVKDKQEDLTREPEMVRTYRDTWHLGIHSYLSYLSDRLVVARDLLADTGSIFVQISSENLHRVRNLLDEVFGQANSAGVITFFKSGSQTSDLLPSMTDYLLWYARDIQKVKRRPIWYHKSEGRSAEQVYRFVRLESGEVVPLDETGEVPQNGKLFRLAGMTSQSGSTTTTFPFELEGRSFSVPRGGWRTNLEGMTRLRNAEMITPSGTTIACYKFIDDFPLSPHGNLWVDTGTGSFTDPKVYVVQTGTKVVQRCMMMTTDPGDLVLDPTCGSGTTAYVAEQWGRRWITTDTSRVAIAIARQRLLTAKFDSYRTKGTRPDAKGHPIPDPASGFNYKTVPHITLKSIAQNVALDPIFARHEPILTSRIADLNAVTITAALRDTLCAKYATKAAKDGISSLTDADARRWLLPGTKRAQIAEALDKAFRKADKSSPSAKQIDAAFDRVPTPAKVGPSSIPKGEPGWEHWQVPFDTDPEYPKPLAAAVTAYRAAWRAKMDEVNACIAASADQEELVDQPEVVKNVVRVSGPFSVEAVQPPEMSLGEVLEAPLPEGGAGGGFAGDPEALTDTFEVRMVEPTNALEVANVGAYLDQMLRYLRADGVRFLNNRQMKWSRLEPLFDSGSAAAAMGFHAEGRWTTVAETDKDPDGPANVAVAFGPQYGPVTGPMVVELLRNAHRRGYDHVVVAGFNFDGAAQTEVENQGNPKVKIHLAHIRPDINPGMNGLLKEVPKAGSGQLFTVFGQPRISVDGPRKKGDPEEGMYTVTMEGVDIYNPVDDSIVSSGAGKVAAWFLDSDYDGRTFCITQAFFPDKGAWEKLQKALNGKDGLIDAERFEALSGTTSLPFPKGKHKCVAVKVIDPRGNEVMAVEKL